MKTCKVCKVEKSLDQFNVRSDSGNPRGECKCCQADYIKNRNNKIKVGPKIQVTEKECNICHTVKSISEFHKNATKEDGHTVDCIECRKPNSSKYYHSNKEEICEESRQKYQENIEEERQYSSLQYYKHHDKNKARKREYNKSEQGKQKNREWQADQMKNNPIFRIKKNLRNRTRDAMKRYHTKRITSSVDSLKLEDRQLGEYFESMWEDGMNFDNYGKGEGKWNIDHYVPLDYFNLLNPEDCKIVHHYLNLKPVWEKENRNKWNSMPSDYVEHIETIKRTLEQV